jgi:hypothetical protein
VIRVEVGRFLTSSEVIGRDRSRRRLAVLLIEVDATA